MAQLGGTDRPRPRWLVEMVRDKRRKSLPADTAEVNLEDLAIAIDAIPNSIKVTWDEWNRVGMAVWRATGGGTEGFRLFREWSRKWPRYDAKRDAKVTVDRWHAYSRSPPTHLTAATIFWLADQADRSWRARAEAAAFQRFRKAVRAAQ